MPDHMKSWQKGWRGQHLLPHEHDGLADKLSYDSGVRDRATRSEVIPMSGLPMPIGGIGSGSGGFSDKIAVVVFCAGLLFGAYDNIALRHNWLESVGWAGGFIYGGSADAGNFVLQKYPDSAWLQAADWARWFITIPFVVIGAAGAGTGSLAVSGVEEVGHLLASVFTQNGTPSHPNQATPSQRS